MVVKPVVVVETFLGLHDCDYKLYIHSHTYIRTYVRTYIHTHTDIYIYMRIVIYALTGRQANGHQNLHIDINIHANVETDDQYMQPKAHRKKDG